MVDFDRMSVSLFKLKIIDSLSSSKTRRRDGVEFTNQSSRFQGLGYL